MIEYTVSTLFAHFHSLLRDSIGLIEDKDSLVVVCSQLLYAGCMSGVLGRDTPHPHGALALCPVQQALNFKGARLLTLIS